MIGIHSFLQHLKHVKRFSDHTLCAYKNDLFQFKDYLFQTYQTDNINDSQPLMIRSWFVDLFKQNCTRTTINRKRSALKSYFRYAIREGVVINNPMDKIATVKKEKKLPVYVEEQSLNSLFDRPLAEGCFESTRDRLILLLLYTTGMRLSELTGIKITDIDLFSRTVRILGKGNKQRVVPLLQEVTNLIQDYLELRKNIEPARDNAHLLVTVKGKELYRKFVYNVVNSYLSTATTIRKKSPHVLRHSFATHMLNHGADLNAIKEILGHANLSATQVYTHNSITKIRSVYKQAHPKA